MVKAPGVSPAAHAAQPSTLLCAHVSAGLPRSRTPARRCFDAGTWLIFKASHPTAELNFCFQTHIPAKKYYSRQRREDRRSEMLTGTWHYLRK